MNEITRKDGGPAYPQAATSNLYVPEQGMTLRDYFASKAMQADYGAVQASGKCALFSDIAARAYIVADAMLKERAK